MNTYNFAGTIYPSGVLHIKNFTLDAEALEGYDVPFSGNLSLTIHDDTVIVVFITDLDFDSDLDTLRKTLEYFSQVVIDSANFYYGTGVELFLTMGGNTSKNPFIFQPKVNSLFRNHSKRPTDSVELTKLAIKHIHLRKALEQTKNAVKNSTDTGFYCYKAIEAIRKYFLNGNDDEGSHRRRSWNTMNNTLKVESTYYTLIKSKADVERHAGVISTTSIEAEEMFHKTWHVIDRFILYLKGVDISTSDEYQLLS